MTEQYLLNKQIATFEPFTGFLSTISSDHTYIHEGKGYNAIHKETISSSYKVGLTTPSSGYVHWRPAAVSSSSANIQYFMYEGDTFSSGTAITPVNLNRNSSTTSTMVSVAEGVTSTPTGTLIAAGQVGTSGTVVAQSGGGGGANEERVLKQDETYIIEFVPSAETDLIFELFWYEESQG